MSYEVDTHLPPHSGDAIVRIMLGDNLVAIVDPDGLLETEEAVEQANIMCKALNDSETE